MQLTQDLDSILLAHDTQELMDQIYPLCDSTDLHYGWLWPNKYNLYYC